MICDFCERKSDVFGLMCKLCSISYDRYLREHDGSIHTCMVWAAKRARYFERFKRTPHPFPRRKAQHRK